MSETLVTAKLSRLRIAPRKVRLVADLVRGKSVEEARHILKFTIKAAAEPIRKLLESAVANARHNFKLNIDDLQIKSITVDEGPVLKRSRPESRGRIAPIHKKTSHINLVLVAKIAEESNTVESPKKTDKKTGKKKVEKKAVKISKKVQARKSK